MSDSSGLVPALSPALPTPAQREEPLAFAARRPKLPTHVRRRRGDRRAWEEGGEPAGVAELRRRFPLVADNEQARRCVRAIVGWGAPRRPAPDQEEG